LGPLDLLLDRGGDDVRDGLRVRPGVGGADADDGAAFRLGVVALAAPGGDQCEPDERGDGDTPGLISALAHGPPPQGVRTFRENGANASPIGRIPFFFAASSNTLMHALTSGDGLSGLASYSIEIRPSNFTSRSAFSTLATSSTPLPYTTSTFFLLSWSFR